MDTTTQDPGCGNKSHADSCLCDVVIREEVEVLYDLTEVYGAETVCKQLNLGKPWNTASLAKLAEGLLDRYDKYRSIADLLPPEGLYEGNEPKPARLTPAVHAALRAGFSIVELPDLFDVDFDIITMAFTTSRPSFVHQWDEKDWLRLEDAIGVKPKLSAIARDWGVTLTRVRQVVAKYDASTGG